MTPFFVNVRVVTLLTGDRAGNMVRLLDPHCMTLRKNERGLACVVNPIITREYLQQQHTGKLSGNGAG